MQTVRSSSPRQTRSTTFVSRARTFCSLSSIAPETVYFNFIFSLLFISQIGVPRIVCPTKLAKPKFFAFVFRFTSLAATIRSNSHKTHQHHIGHIQRLKLTTNAFRRHITSLPLTSVNYAAQCAEKESTQERTQNHWESVRSARLHCALSFEEFNSN